MTCPIPVTTDRAVTLGKGRDLASRYAKRDHRTGTFAEFIAISEVETGRAKGKVVITVAG
jgi:hypothetical protein